MKLKRNVLERRKGGKEKGRKMNVKDRRKVEEKEGNGEREERKERKKKKESEEKIEKK